MLSCSEGKVTLGRSKSHAEWKCLGLMAETGSNTWSCWMGVDESNYSSLGSLKKKKSRGAHAADSVWSSEIFTLTFKEGRHEGIRRCVLFDRTPLFVFGCPVNYDLCSYQLRNPVVLAVCGWYAEGALKEELVVCAGFRLLHTKQ